MSGHLTTSVHNGAHVPDYQSVGGCCASAKYSVVVLRSSRPANRGRRNSNYHIPLEQPRCMIVPRPFLRVEVR